MMELKTTNRGFAIAEFTDKYGAKCSIQQSASSLQDSIWLGVDDADPKIMATDAKKLGIETDVKGGWVKYEIPKEVLLATRMHLTQEMVKELLPLLKKFAKTGRL